MLLQELLGHCLQLFQENQVRISQLESYLEQYGYQPQAVPVNPLLHPKAAGKGYGLGPWATATAIAEALSTAGEKQTAADMQAENAVGGSMPQKHVVTLLHNHIKKQMRLHLLHACAKLCSIFICSRFNKSVFHMNHFPGHA